MSAEYTRVTLRKIPVLAVLLTLAGLAAAQRPFELAISGNLPPYGCPIPRLAYGPALEWHGPYRFDFPTDVRAIASSDGRTIFAVLHGSPLRVVKLQPDDSRTPFYSAAGDGSDALIAVARNGRVFVGSGELRVLSPAGVHEATWTLPEYR